MNTIPEFVGEYRFLSNFWPAPVMYDGLKYPTVEHAYQAAKTRDIGQRLAIRNCVTPGEAKRLGRRVTLRSDWEDWKGKVMENLVRQKFNQHPGLAEKLLATYGSRLEEGNAWHDTFWGISPVGSGIGQNRLGQILMAVRSELKK